MSHSYIKCDILARTIMMDWLLWLRNLTKKLPTLKGIAAWFYVATHWTTISEDLDRYRKQIEDERQWRKDSEDLLKKIHDLEKQKIVYEFDQKLKTASTVLNDFIEGYILAVAKLTVHYHLHPLEWELDRHSINPSLRQAIDTGMAHLPPPPPESRTLRDIFTRTSYDHDTIK